PIDSTPVVNYVAGSILASRLDPSGSSECQPLRTSILASRPLPSPARGLLLRRESHPPQLHFSMPLLDPLGCRRAVVTFWFYFSMSDPRPPGAPLGCQPESAQHTTSICCYDRRAMTDADDHEVEPGCCPSPGDDRRAWLRLGVTTVAREREEIVANRVM